MSHPWMPFYVGDYLSKTIRLTTAEHGAYMLLIMEYWQQRGLTDDDAQFARIVRMTEREWKKIRATIQSFFTDGWHHERIEDELAKADIKHGKRVDAGKRGGNAKEAAKHSPSKPPSNATHREPSNALASSSQPQSLTPTSLRSVAPPPKKRASVIAPNFKPDIEEALAIGLTLDEALSEAASFVDYWGSVGKPKASWPLTWRVWCRKTMKDRAKGTRNGPGRSSVEVHTAGMASALAKRRGNREREAVLAEEISKSAGGVSRDDNRMPLVIEHDPWGDG